MSPLCVFCTLPLLDATEKPEWHDRCFAYWQDELNAHDGSCDGRRLLYAEVRDAYAWFCVMNVLKNLHTQVWGYPKSHLDPTSRGNKRGEIPDYFFDKIETEISVLSRLMELPENEWRVIYFLYIAWPRLTVRETREVMGASERQVYRFRARAIKKMSSNLERPHLEARGGNPVAQVARNATA